jgi:hypothetical protein
VVGIDGEDVKWKTKEQLINKIKAAENYLRITVVTPIKTCVTNKKRSERCNSREFVTTLSSSKVIKDFPPSDSRTSPYSSMSSASDKFRTFKKKRPWSVGHTDEKILRE